MFAMIRKVIVFIVFLMILTVGLFKPVIKEEIAQLVIGILSIILFLFLFYEFYIDKTNRKKSREILNRKLTITKLNTRTGSSEYIRRKGL